jgi:hypothetical protein
MMGVKYYSNEVRIGRRTDEGRSNAASAVDGMNLKDVACWPRLLKIANRFLFSSFWA